MNNKQKELWEITRNQGIIRFILVTGILKFSLFVVLVPEIYFYIYDNGFTDANIANLFTSRNIFSFSFKVLFGGLLFGSIAWFWTEKEYKQLN